MPSLRVSRLCEPRLKEVQQPVKVRHTHRPSHSKRPHLRHRQGMRSFPSSASCSMLKLDGCIPKQDLRRLCRASCGCHHPRKVKRPQWCKSPSAHAKFPLHHALLEDHDKLFDDLHGKNVAAYQQLRSPRRGLNRSMNSKGKAKLPPRANPSHHRVHFASGKNLVGDFEDANVGAYRRLQSWEGVIDSEDDNHRFDDEVLDSSFFANEQFDKVAYSEFKEMHVNGYNHQKTVASSCSGNVAAAEHEYHMSSSKIKRIYNPNAHKRVSYTRSILPVGVGGAEFYNANHLPKQEPIKKGCTSSDSTMRRHYATVSIGSDQEVQMLHALMLSKQRAFFRNDGIFYHKPKAQVNAPRRSMKSKLDSYSPQNTNKHVDAAPRTSRKSYERKANEFHNSTTRTRLRSFDGLELPRWSSSLNRRVVPSQVDEQSLDKLECVAVQESAETTEDIMKCLRLAENINDEATGSLNALYQQGEQMQHAHEHTLDIDYNLNAGEKVLGSLGGFFTKAWKPVKTRAITGPQNGDQKRTALKAKTRSDKGVSHRGKNRAQFDLMGHMQLPWQTKVEIEENKQDEALDNLSNVVSDLKRISLDMGTELSRQTEALDPFQDEVVELSQRLKKANLRGRFLLA